jgi:hypothetical protein
MRLIPSLAICATLALLLADSANSAGCTPDEKIIVTHPIRPNSPPDARLRCGKEVAPGVIEVPPSGPVSALPPPPPPAVHVVRVIEVKRVVVALHQRARAHHQASHGPFDFLGSIFHPHHGG